jgi:hypothetical protein
VAALLRTTLSHEQRDEQPLTPDYAQGNPFLADSTQLTPDLLPLEEHLSHGTQLIFAGFERALHLLDSTYYLDIIQLSFGNLPKYVCIVTMLA